MDSTTPADDWWPEWLQNIRCENPLATDPVIVSAVEETSDAHEYYRQLSTALVPVEKLEPVLEHAGGIGYEVSSSGPHPADSPGKWGYTARFWVLGPEGEEFEPLVVAWRSGGERLIMWPDQGFLMTYGLVARTEGLGEASIVHWDDPEAPRYDVVVGKHTSSFNFPAYVGAEITMARDFLQDYATIRNCALIQVYFLQKTGPLTSEIAGLMKDREIVDFRLKGRLVDLRRIPGRDKEVLAQVWGVRPLLRPGPAPISEGRWDYGSLEWPGISGLIGHDRAMGLGPQDVYVRDTVLGAYEGEPGFTIHPESGGVSFGHQWSVSWTRRVGRDVIAVEVKKLYEGNRPETVRHWHGHAVEGPHGPKSTENVGSRTRRIVYALASVGEALAELGVTLGLSYSAADFVRVDKTELDDNGWWMDQDAERVSRHIAESISEDDLLKRCGDLHKLVVEGLGESRLRALAAALNVPAEYMENFRSLKLLNLVTRFARLAQQTGLSLNQGTVLYGRIDEVESLITPLFRLNDLRQLAGHKAKKSRRAGMEDALQSFGVSLGGYAGRLGLALDKVYDLVAETLERVAVTLRDA